MSIDFGERELDLREIGGNVAVPEDGALEGNLIMDCKNVKVSRNYVEELSMAMYI